MTQPERIKTRAKHSINQDINQDINENARSPLEPGLRKDGSADANGRLIAGGTPVPRVDAFGIRTLTEEEVEALFDNMPV